MLCAIFNVVKVSELTHDFGRGEGLSHMTSRVFDPGEDVGGTERVLVPLGVNLQQVQQTGAQGAVVDSVQGTVFVA